MSKVLQQVHNSPSLLGFTIFSTKSLFRRIGFNIGFLSIANLTQAVTTFVIYAYLGQRLGVNSFGLFSIISSFAAISMLIAKLGIDTLIIREISHEPQHTEEYTNGFLSIRSATTIIIIPIASLLGCMLYRHDPHIYQLIPLLLIKEGLTSITVCVFAIFRAHHTMKYESITTVLFSIVQATVSFILIYWTDSLFTFIVGLLVAELLRLLGAWLFLRNKLIAPRLSFHPHLWKLVWKDGMLLGWASLSVMLYTRIDLLLLSVYRSPEEVGLYSAAYKILTALTLLSSSILPVLFPIFARTSILDTTKVKRLFYTSLTSLAGMAIGIVIIVTIYASWIVNTLYGPEFSKAILPIQILSWAIIFIFTNNLCGITLNAINKTRANAVIVTVGAVVNISLNLILIPFYGYISASIVTVFTEFFILVVCLLYISKFFRYSEVQC